MNRPMMWLGRLSMYRVVLASLGLVILASLAYAAVGVLHFGVLDALVSLVVAIGVAYAVDGLASAALRRPQHPESALITGGLVYTIFTPTMTGQGLGAVALASGVGILLKVLVVWRGRALLNPAAAGAVVTSLVGVGFATWWIATGPLLPFVALGALAIGLRIRRLGLVLGFVALAVALITLRMALVGVPIGDAVTTALVSLPMVFVAGFMLTEPTTLPPRAWQRALVALAVALVITVPFTWGNLYNSPELALIAGNIVAFALARPGGGTLRVASVERRPGDVTVVHLTGARPLRARAGQFVELTVPHRSDRRGPRRSLSIAGAPGSTSTTIAFSVPEQNASSFKRALAEATPGTAVRATVGGDFTLPNDRGTKVLYVAGGIGVTPFLAHRAAEPDRDAVLVLRTSNPDSFAADLGATRVVLFGPVPEAGLPATWVHGGTERPTAAAILDAVPDAAQRIGYLSGPPALIRELRPALAQAGVKRIRVDEFTGY